MQSSSFRHEEIIAYAQKIVDAIRNPLLILDADLRILCANRAFYDEFQLPVPAVEHQKISGISEGVWNQPELIALLHDTALGRTEFDDFEFAADFPRIGLRELALNGRQIIDNTSDQTLLAVSMEDVTVRKSHESDQIHAQDQDKKIALALQRPILFQPKEDAFSGLAVQTAYAMASEEALVGGDFWDTFAYDHGHVALVIGDVMGHGLSSAIFTSELKHTMRAYIREHEQPSQILYHMNRFLFQSNRLYDEGFNTEGSNAPVCIAIAVIDRETGAGTLAIAGMEPPMLIRADGATEQSAAVGLPLGIVGNESYRQLEFKLEVGDTLILTTDGITEARQGRKFLDAEGLMRLAVAGNGGTLKEMADTILTGAQEFAGGKLKDDAAIVLVRRAPTSPHLEPKRSDP